MTPDEYAEQARRVEAFDRNLIDAEGARLAAEARSRLSERDLQERTAREDAELAVRVAQEALPPASPQALATLAAAILQRLPRA